jgi:hypothetical protein
VRDCLFFERGFLDFAEMLLKKIVVEGTGCEMRKEGWREGIGRPGDLISIGLSWS